MAEPEPRCRGARRLGQRVAEALDEERQRKRRHDPVLDFGRRAAGDADPPDGAAVALERLDRVPGADGLRGRVRGRASAIRP